LVVAKVRGRLAVSKRAAQKIDTDRFDVKKLNEADVKEQYQVTIRNKCAALENLEDSGDINKAWDNIRENIKISAQESLGYCESKQCKLWLTRNVQNLLIKGSRLNYSGCRTQVKRMKITCVMYGRKLVDISGTRKGNMSKTRLTSLYQTLSIITSEICMGA
jgi:hypothetical protein